jgi:chondroitin AC lyase
MQKPQNHVEKSYGGKMPVQMKGLTDYVGGWMTDFMVQWHTTSRARMICLEARKSWFFFDNEYVCLGAGIKSSPDLPAYTTMNQAHLRGYVTVSQQGQTKVIPRSKSDLKNVKWVHHDRVGYIFPEPATVNLSNSAQQGRWSDISATKSASREPVTQDVFLLGIDHGNRPQNASYQYIVVPGITPEELAATSAITGILRFSPTHPTCRV